MHNAGVAWRTEWKSEPWHWKHRSQEVDTEEGRAGALLTPFTKWHFETLLKTDGSKNKSLSFKIIKKVNKRLSNIIQISNNGRWREKGGRKCQLNSYFSYKKIQRCYLKLTRNRNLHVIKTYENNSTRSWKQRVK